MNLFFLHKNVRKSVRDYSNQHVVKILLEAVQLLYAAHHTHGGHKILNDEAPNGGYRATHLNHPMTKWVASSPANYAMACKYAQCLVDEYGRRYPNRVHKCAAHVTWLQENIPTFAKGVVSLTPIPLCMPDEYRLPGATHGTLSEAVACYRRYYKAEKVVFKSGRAATWPDGMKPAWLEVEQ